MRVSGISTTLTKWDNQCGIVNPKVTKIGEQLKFFKEPPIFATSNTCVIDQKTTWVVILL